MLTRRARIDENTVQIKSTLTISIKPLRSGNACIGILHDCKYIILHVTRPVRTSIVQMHNSVRTTFRTCISTASLVIHEKARDNVFCLEYYKKQRLSIMKMVIKLKRFIISLPIVWIACIRRDQNVPYKPGFKAVIVVWELNSTFNIRTLSIFYASLRSA